jgi:hypothetical protein
LPRGNFCIYIFLKGPLKSLFTATKSHIHQGISPNEKEVLIFAKNSQPWGFLGDSKPNNTHYIKKLASLCLASNVDTKWQNCDFLAGTFVRPTDIVSNIMIMTHQVLSYKYLSPKYFNPASTRSAEKRKFDR